MQKSYRSNSEFFNSQEHLQSVVNGLDQRNNYMIEGLDNNVEDLTGIIPPADAIANVDVTPPTMTLNSAVPAERSPTTF